MSKKQVDELKAELQKVRTQLRDTQRLVVSLYLIGANASKVANDAGLNAAVDEKLIADAIAMFDRGEIEIKEAAQ